MATLPANDDGSSTESEYYFDPQEQKQEEAPYAAHDPVKQEPIPQPVEPNEEAKSGYRVQPMDVDASSASPRASSSSSSATDLDPVTEPTQPLDPSVVSLHHHFGILSSWINNYVSSPTHKDATGAGWRIVWQPCSPTDNKSVAVFVELVTQPDDQKLRPAQLSIALLNQGEHPHVVKHTSVHLFSWENPIFGMSEFYLRRELLNPRNRFLTEALQVEVEVKLSFVEQEQQPDVVLPHGALQPQV
jgi:hypothetical protein